MNAGETAQQRLPRAVKERRLYLRLSVRAAAKLAGIDRGTWMALEEGSRKTQDSNYAGIEMALQWPPGQIVKILKGPGRDTGAGPTDAEIAKWTFHEIGDYAARLANGPEGLPEAIRWTGHALDVLIESTKVPPNGG
jgi:hypothetical protein